MTGFHPDSPTFWRKPYLFLHAFALSGRTSTGNHTQGVALGCWLAAPSGRYSMRLITQGVALGWRLAGLSGRITC